MLIFESRTASHITCWWLSWGRGSNSLWFLHVDSGILREGQGGIWSFSLPSLGSENIAFVSRADRPHGRNIPWQHLVTWLVTEMQYETERLGDGWSEPIMGYGLQIGSGSCEARCPATQFLFLPPGSCRWGWHLYEMKLTYGWQVVRSQINCHTYCYRSGDYVCLICIRLKSSILAWNRMVSLKEWQDNL